MSVVRKIILVAVLLSVTAPLSSQTKLSSPAGKVVAGLLAAFNDHDPESMAALVADEVIWFSVAGDSMVVEVSGREALRQAMASYFEAIPSTRSVVEGALENGAFISVRERSYWQGKSGEVSRAAIAVYEVRDEKIVRVWYYPAQE